MGVNYDDLLQEAADQNLIVKEKDIPGYGGRIYKNRIAINRSMTEKEKIVVLAEELGHHYTTAGDILNQSDVGNRKQEHRARAWAYQKLIRPEEIAAACVAGCRTCSDLAEFLDLPEAYIAEVLQYFEAAYGERTITAGNFMIKFSPRLEVSEIQP